MAQHPNSAANVVRGRFQKGQPKPAGSGRKKGGLTRLTWNKLHEKCKRKFGSKLEYDHPEFGRVQDIHQLAYLELFEAVKAKKSWAISMVLDRELGKPPAHVQQEVTRTNQVVLDWGQPVIDINAAGVAPATRAQGSLDAGGEIVELGGQEGSMSEEVIEEGV